ncbi:PREDICTED: uncharacterized protein LOC108367340 [Rhagoletis zephyria]|uniref:uncharacterized protein LOC108367340 n=1 Tax=Rhagoletis zephyria TaxID=28612 RepID=UPI000811A66C|nr:PREDICTED: uncharacterized protein LOC108367340 [Rhagoletis zephyria]
MDDLELVMHHYVQQFMESHQDLAKNFVKSDRVNAEEKWKELAMLLNAEGPPQKDVNGWKKIWSDWKANIKKKVAHDNMESRATGGRPFNKYILTQNEESVARICGIFAAVEGIAQARTFGTQEETESVKVGESDEDEPPQKSHAAVSAQPRKRARTVDNEDCLRLCMTTQNETMKTIAITLGEICENQKNNENNYDFERLCKAVETQNQLLAEQNSLMRRDIEEKKKHHIKMEQLVQEKVKIKRGCSS